MNKFITETSYDTASSQLNSIYKATRATIEGFGYGFISLILYAAPMAIVYFIFHAIK